MLPVCAFRILSKGHLSHPTQFCVWKTPVRPLRLGGAAFAVIGTLLHLSLCSVAQSDLNLTGTSNCTAADFESYVDFANGPGDNYSVVILKRNISNHACVFDGSVYGPSLVPDRIEGEPPVELCYDCENRRLPPEQRRMAPSITVNPGEVARQTLRWKTKPANTSGKCLKLEWIGEPVVLVIPSLLKPVCSEVDFSPFTPASNEEAAAMPDMVKAAALKISSDKPQYYAGENFSFRVAGEEPRSPAETCPKLYLWHRSPDGATRVDEVLPLAIKGCEHKRLGHEEGDWASGFEIDSGANSRWMGVGEHTTQIFELTGSPDDAELHFSASNVLRFKIADPTRIARKWGPRVKGTGADVTLDKNTYRLGEDIALHVAVEDFEAGKALYAWSPVWDPCVAISIRVRDGGGRVLPPEERLPNRSFCSGHGLGPRPITRGEVIAIERSLADEGWLPSRPGTYTVEVEWATCAGPKPSDVRSPEQLAAKLRAYAVARATETFQIVK